VFALAYVLESACNHLEFDPPYSTPALSLFVLCIFTDSPKHSFSHRLVPSRNSVCFSFSFLLLSGPKRSPPSEDHFPPPPVPCWASLRLQCLRLVSPPILFHNRRSPSATSPAPCFVSVCLSYKFTIPPQTTIVFFSAPAPFFFSPQVGPRKLVIPLFFPLYTFRSSSLFSCLPGLVSPSQESILSL